MLEGTYTLNCDNCGNTYQSKEGFPKPQLCPKCLLWEADDADKTDDRCP